MAGHDLFVWLDRLGVSSADRDSPIGQLLRRHGIDAGLDTRALIGTPAKISPRIRLPGGDNLRRIWGLFLHYPAQRLGAPPVCA